MLGSKVLRVSLLILVATTMLLAQGDSSGIRGTVMDPSGAVIPGASVTVTKADTGVSYQAVSTGAGNYGVRGLRAGIYTVEVEQPGFKRLIQENVVVTVGAVTGLDLTLEVGATTETVEVVAALPMLKKETTDTSMALDPKTWLDLPLNATGTRNPAHFVVLSPGVSGRASEDFSHTINGGQLLGHQVLIDGMDASMANATPGDTRMAIGMAPEALQEFTLSTSNFSAEFGNTTGGYYSFTIRSGTNALHGTLYEFFRNDALDSADYFATSKGKLRQNEYGGTVGGPVFIPGAYDGRNKSFWFFSYRRFIQRGAPSANFITVPTAPFKAGDFTNLLDGDGNQIPIFDPATTRLNAAGDFIRDPFPNNIIPLNRHSPITTKAIAFWPAPTSAGETDNFLETRANKSFRRSYTMKFDHRISSKFSAHFSANRSNLPFERCLVNCYSPTEVGASAQFIGATNSEVVRGSLDIMVSPTVMVTFSGGAGRHDNPSNQRSQVERPAGGWPAFFGIKGVIGTQGPFPEFLAPPYADLGSAAAQNEKFGGNQWALQQSISMVRGKHNFRIGAEQRANYAFHPAPSNSGFYNFSRAGTADPSDIGGTGDSLASMILGDVHEATQHVQEFVGDALFSYHSAYIQDDYKMLPNLTWNIGMRWDLYLPMYSKHDNFAIMDPSVPNPRAGNLPGAIIYAGHGPGRAGRRRLTPPLSWNNWGPRLGFAWEVRPGTVIRSAYGITYFPGTAQGSGSVREQAPGFAANHTVTTSDGGITPAFNIADGWPTFIVPPSIDPGFGLGGRIHIFSASASEPAYMQQWHFTIQQELARDWMYEIAYVASKGTRLNSGMLNPNQVHPMFLSLGDSLLRANINSPQAVAAGFRPPFPGFDKSVAQSLRPFPQYDRVFGGVGDAASHELHGAQVGNSTYHSLQMKLQKQLSRGLFLQSSYTWAKHISDSGSSMGGFRGRTPRDQFNRGLEKGLPGTHTPHKLTVAFAYELPFGPGKPYGSDADGALAKIIGGWQVNGVMDYMAGRPILVLMSNNLPIFNNLYQREIGPRRTAGYPDVVSGVPQTVLTGGDHGNPRADLYLNPDAFKVPDFPNFGDAPQGLPGVRGFAFLNENFGLMKNTPINEKFSLQFRFEMFNAFNRHSFGRALNNNISVPSSFGKVFGVFQQGRDGQFAMKLIF